MNKTGISLALIIVIALIILGWYSWSPKDTVDTIKEDESMMVEEKDNMQAEDTTEDDDSMTNEPDMVMENSGSYEVYSQEKLALADTGDVVLFFRASWCPTCRGLDEDIKSHKGDIPEDLTILDVDYDTYTDLKQKYGVTYQHTLVQVDSDGKQIAKWSGSPTLSELVKKVI